MDLNDLGRIGLTEGEIRVYKALLELGEATRTILAKRSGISPSKIYDVANRLEEKGMVSKAKKNGVLHFHAANPHRLLDYIDKKESEIKQEKDVVRNLLPQLFGLYERKEEQVAVEVFSGWEGMMTVYKEIAETMGPGDINYIFGASRGENPKQTDIFFHQYNRMIEEAGYKLKIIFNEEMRGKERVEPYEKSKLHEIRYLYRRTFSELNFYKDTVLFVMLLKNPIVIRVKNKEAADSFKKFFESMWSQAKP